MRTFLRGKVTLLFLTLGLLLAIPAVALADNVVNDVVAGGNDTITAGGSTTITYKIAPAAAADPQSGCNASDGSPATVNLSVPTGVTASQTSFTFTDCAPQSQSVTFSSNTAGDYPITVSSISDSGTGSYKNQADFTLHVNAATPSDTTGPDITITTPPEGATYLVNQQVLADYACSDPSGVATCAGSQGSTSVADGAAIDTGSVESKSFTVNATDTLNNASSLTHNYTVRRYDFDGFSSPVDNPTVLNSAKAGQAIPLKWRLTDNGSPVTDLAGVTVTTVSRSCTTGVEGTDVIEQYAAGSSGLQNLGDGYYQFNWKSPTNFANSCKTLTINGIGVQQQAYFQFKK